MKNLGVELIEIENWNCCGASAAESVSDLLSYVLPARNLAIAEKMCAETGEALEVIQPNARVLMELPADSQAGDMLRREKMAL